MYGQTFPPSDGAYVQSPVQEIVWKDSMASGQGLGLLHFVVVFALGWCLVKWCNVGAGAASDIVLLCSVSS